MRQRKRGCRNIGADEIAKQALSKARSTSTYLKMEVQKHPSIEKIHIFTIQSESSQMTQILSFLQDGRLPQGIEEARKVRKRAARFTILNDVLYKRGFSMPYLKCVNENEAKYIPEEIHEGICGDHAGPRSVVSKIIKKVTFGLQCKRTQKNSLSDATSVKDLEMFSISQQKS